MTCESCLEHAPLSSIYLGDGWVWICAFCRIGIDPGFFLDRDFIPRSPLASQKRGELFGIDCDSPAVARRSPTRPAEAI